MRISLDLAISLLGLILMGTIRQIQVKVLIVKMNWENKNLNSSERRVGYIKESRSIQTDYYIYH